MSTPPLVGKTASVKVDQQTYDDLETMLATGMTVTDAFRSALHMMAGIYQKVWANTDVPYGDRPTIERFFLTRYDPAQPPERGSVQATVPAAYWVGRAPDHTGVTARPTQRPTGLPPSHQPLPVGTTRHPQRPTAIRPGESWPTPS